MSHGSRFMRYGCLILLGFMLLACGGAIMYGLAGLKDLPEALDNSNAFLNQLNKNEVDPAYASTAPEFQASMTREKFRETVAKYPLLTKKTTRKLGGLKMAQLPQGTRAVIEFNLSDPSNTLALSLTMKKVGDAWKVESIKLP